MLKGQYGSRYQNGDLLTIVNSFKSCPYGHLGFTKTNVPANKSVHGSFTFHVLFDVFGRFALVRGIFIDKRGFQFMLQITVGAILKPFFQPTLGIELYKVEGNFFNAGFCFVLDFFPGPWTQLVYFWWGTVLTIEFRNFVKRVYADIKNVPFAIHQFYSFLFLAFNIYLLQTSEFSNTVVYMGNIVSNFQFVQVL